MQRSVPVTDPPAPIDISLRVRLMLRPASRSRVRRLVCGSDVAGLSTLRQSGCCDAPPAQYEATPCEVQLRSECAAH